MHKGIHFCSIFREYAHTFNNSWILSRLCRVDASIFLLSLLWPTKGTAEGCTLVKEPRPGVGLSLYNAKIPAFRLGFALQDGLEFKKMKLLEIFGNRKKLIINKLQQHIKKLSKVKISPNLKFWLQIGYNFQGKYVSLHRQKYNIACHNSFWEPTKVKVKLPCMSEPDVREFYFAWVLVSWLM